MNIVSPTLSMGLPIIAVPPAQPPQPYLRHGCGPELAIERRVERNEWTSASCRRDVCGPDSIACEDKSGELRGTRDEERVD